VSAAGYPPHVTQSGIGIPGTPYLILAAGDCDEAVAAREAAWLLDPAGLKCEKREIRLLLVATGASAFIVCVHFCTQISVSPTSNLIMSMALIRSASLIDR